MKQRHEPRTDEVVSWAREEDQNRHYLLTLIGTKASCMTLLVTIGMLLVLEAFGVPLKDVKGFMAGATITVAGLYLWADREMSIHWSKVFRDPWYGED